MAFWVTLFRGLLAISLGVVLLFLPGKALPMLANFMGIFWLLAGVTSLRWSASGERARGLSLVAGVIGVLAGLVMISRHLTDNVVSFTTLLDILAVVILLTGLLHIVGGFRTGEDAARQRSWTSVLLGVFEVVLGILLLITRAAAPTGFGRPTYLAFTIWALIGGLILIGEALRVRKARLSQKD